MVVTGGELESYSDAFIHYDQLEPCPGHNNNNNIHRPPTHLPFNSAEAAEECCVVLMMATGYNIV